MGSFNVFCKLMNHNFSIGCNHLHWKMRHCISILSCNRDIIVILKWRGLICSLIPTRYSVKNLWLKANSHLNDDLIFDKFHPVVSGAASWPPHHHEPWFLTTISKYTRWSYGAAFRGHRSWRLAPTESARK